MEMGKGPKMKKPGEHDRMKIMWEEEESVKTH